MENVFASNLNETGASHVANELHRLGLDWDVSATCSEIEEKQGFMELEPSGWYDYEISNTAAGKSGYGAFGWIDIRPEHVQWEALEYDE